MKTQLAAEKLRADPRIKQAKELLLASVKEHAGSIKEVRPPIPELKQGYEETLKAFAELRGNKLWFPYLGSGIGNGPLVELLDGSIKYDFISGIGVHYLGHSHPDLLTAAIDAAISDTVMQGHLQQNGEAVELSKTLCQAAGIEHCFLTSSGAMANENALKIIFQKRAPAQRILAFEHCFAGRTWALTQITDKPSFREGIPSNVFVDYVPFFDATKPEESTQRAVSILKQYLARHPKEYAVMIFELVQGENGFYVGQREFFKALMDICKENQITIFVDEVQTFGRTSRLFAYQHFGLDDYVDVATIGKLSQTCATLYRKDHNPKPGLLSQTFISSTTAIRASQVVLHHLLKGDFFGTNGKNMRIHQQFSRNLGELAKKYPGKVAGPFGIGAMVAFTPLDGKQQTVTKFVHALFEEGVIGFIAGESPVRTRFLVPAGAVEDKDIDRVTEIIEKVIKST